MPRNKRRPGKGGRSSRTQAAAGESRSVSEQSERPAAPQAAAPARMTPVARREAQRQARMHATRSQRQRIYLLIGGGVAALVVLIVVLAVLSNIGPRPGTETPNDGREHIAEGTLRPASAYSSDPPTSGPHWPASAPRGVYQKQPDQRLIHSLEHGYIVIQHNCAEEECPELYSGLTDIFRRYDAKIILNHRPETDSRIALTAWTRIDKMDEFDEDRIVQFVEAYRGGGAAPEPNEP